MVSWGGWRVRAFFGPVANNNYQDPAAGLNGQEINISWQAQGGLIAVPEGITEMRVTLYNYISSG